MAFFLLFAKLFNAFFCFDGMKIFAFSDFHESRFALKEILAKLRKNRVELVICLGDLAVFGHRINLEMVKRIKDAAGKVPFLVIPGNHETPLMVERLCKELGLINLHNRFFEVSRKKLFGIGGSLSTPFNTPYENKEGFYEKVFCKLEGVDILILHNPVYKTKLDFLDGMNLGTRSARKYIEKNQPELVLCGHLHEHAHESDRIGKSRIINPGAGGEIIEI